MSKVFEARVRSSSSSSGLDKDESLMWMKEMMCTNLFLLREFSQRFLVDVYVHQVAGYVATSRRKAADLAVHRRTDQQMIAILTVVRLSTDTTSVVILPILSTFTGSVGGHLTSPTKPVQSQTYHSKTAHIPYDFSSHLQDQWR